jgi:FkbM family methyltransferase
MKRLANELLARFGYRLRWYPPKLLADWHRHLELHFQHVAAQFMLKQKDIFFISIGANDGMTREPVYPFIRDHGWKGIMVEPISFVFQKLQENLGHFSGVSLVNAAIGERDGSQVIYTVDQSAPKSFKMSFLSSFERSVLLAHKPIFRDIEQHIREETVKVITIPTLLESHQVDRVDVLKIDTEGYDLKILKTLDFSQIKPVIVLAEHAHLSRSEKEEMCEILLDNGYKVTISDLDMLAYRAGLD